MTVRAPRPGSMLVEQARSRRLPLADLKIRCSAQAPGEVPRFALPRFLWSINVVSGALGDLGTLLPHIIGAITVVGMAPSGVLVWFGLH